VNVGDLETPVLTIDLASVERNVTRMQDYCDAHGLALRPHIKTHKSPEIARLQLDAGAVGICCQKLSEAEAMLEAGFGDIFIPYPLVGSRKAGRLAALAQRARFAVAGDAAVAARTLSTALVQAGTSVDYFVDCDTGFGRTGVQSPKEAADLAAYVSKLPGLRLAGLSVYPTTEEAAVWVREARSECARVGVPIETVSGGGTPTAFRTHEIGEIDEVRVGTYVYGDRSCLLAGTHELGDCAARVRTTVVSRPTAERAILDAGSKTLTSDRVPWNEDSGYGVIVEFPDAVITALSEEHGIVDLSRCASRPELGEVVTVIPNHVCTCVNLHDTVVAHRGGQVEAEMAVAARGRVL
jgi:D-serine deaminase-like pyridoxal phosphate-dependent protein